MDIGSNKSVCQGGSHENYTGAGGGAGDQEPSWSGNGTLMCIGLPENQLSFIIHACKSLYYYALG